MSTGDGWRARRRSGAAEPASPRARGGRLLGAVLATSLLASVGRAQPPAELLDLGRGTVLAEVERLLDSRDPADWREAWRIAERVGPALAASLWAKLSVDPKPLRRLVRIGAFAAAAGGASAATLLDESWLRKAKKSELLMALLALALGPALEPTPPLRAVTEISPSPAVRIASALVLARGRAPELRLTTRWLQARSGELDAGLCAAALLCGAELPERALERWLGAHGVPPVDVQLVWRGLLLADPAPVEPSLQLSHARTALQWSGTAARPTRHTAALCIGGSADPGAWLPSGAFLPPDELVRLAHGPPGRALALQRGWLSPVPPVLADARLRGQLAAEFVLGAGQDALCEAAPLWKDAAELRDAACLALAWRAFADPDVVAAGGWLAPLEGSAAFPWLRIAAGGGDSIVGLAPGSPLALAKEQRLPLDAMMREVERELWRQDAHPGAAAWQCWSELVRDLLLAGSDYARAQDARQEAFPYLPADLHRGDELFAPACEFFAWRESERRQVPRDVRLR